MFDLALIFRNPVLPTTRGRTTATVRSPVPRHLLPRIIRAAVGSSFTRRRSGGTGNMPALLCERRNFRSLGGPTDLWAPEVLYYRERLHVRGGCALGKTDGRRHAAAPRPGPQRQSRGPFVWDDKPLIDEWSIDGHPYQDPDGSLWLTTTSVPRRRCADGTTGCGNVCAEARAP